MEPQLKDSRVVKRYSLAFKYKVLSTIRSGRYSKIEASRIFGISDSLIYYWIKRLEPSLFNTRLRVEDINEADGYKALQERINDLEKALAESQLQQFKSRAYLEVAAQRLGYSSWADFEKKGARQPSNGQPGKEFTP